MAIEMFINRFSFDTPVESVDYLQNCHLFLLGRPSRKRLSIKKGASQNF